jgi:hypothetical protein
MLVGNSIRVAYFYFDYADLAATIRCAYFHRECSVCGESTER